MTCRGVATALVLSMPVALELGAQRNAASDPHVRVTSGRAAYPAAAARAGIRGPVVLELTIDREGQVSRADVRSGHPLLAPAAVAAVKTTWRFRRERQPFQMTAGLYVGTQEREGGANLLPPPLFGHVKPDPVWRGVPGRAALQLTIDASGQAIAALGTEGPRDVLLEAVDGALRWKTRPLSPDSAKTFECRVLWLNGIRETAEVTAMALIRVPPVRSRTIDHPSSIVMEIITEPDGTVRDVKVLRSDAPIDPNDAIAAVRQWRYGPFFLSGQAAPAFVATSMRFQE